MKKFLLIAAPRTGSTLLVQLLNSAPTVKCYYELYNQNDLMIDGQNRRDEIPGRDADPMGFLNTIVAETEAEAVGFKIFDNHNEELMQELIQNKDWKKIVLNRRNFLSVYSSRRISEKKAVWAETTHDGKNASIAETSATPTWNETVEFKEKQFWGLYHQHTAFYQRVVNSLNAANQHFEYLEYGDLLNEGLVRRLFPYLGIDQPNELTTSLRRNNTSNILSRFENKTEVREFLKRINRWEWISEGDSRWNLEQE